MIEKNESRAETAKPLFGLANATPCCRLGTFCAPDFIRFAPHDIEKTISCIWFFCFAAPFCSTCRCIHPWRLRRWRWSASILSWRVSSVASITMISLDEYVSVANLEKYEGRTLLAVESGRVNLTVGRKDKSDGDQS
jgi:hypothetical protein